MLIVGLIRGAPMADSENGSARGCTLLEVPPANGSRRLRRRSVVPARPFHPSSGWPRCTSVKDVDESAGNRAVLDEAKSRQPDQRRACSGLLRYRADVTARFGGSCPGGTR